MDICGELGPFRASWRDYSGSAVKWFFDGFCDIEHTLNYPVLWEN